MLLDLASLLLAASLVSGASIPRQDADILAARQDSGDPDFQDIPTKAQADNTYNNGAKMSISFPTTAAVPPAIYGNRKLDIPFGRLYVRILEAHFPLLNPNLVLPDPPNEYLLWKYVRTKLSIPARSSNADSEIFTQHGDLKFFSAGQLNTASKDTDQWTPDGTDSATQSACGIPDNAFSISKVAIHPYFLKYADLSRYCMQDVCISFWKEDGSSDMMLKVTDICSTDPSDPTYCATPGDIKIDRTKAKIMEKLDSAPTGDVYPEKVWWFFMKCWADGLVQPAYTDNWFAQPPLPCNLKWAQATQEQQWKNNQESYPQHDPPLPLYVNGAYNPKRDNTTSPPPEDFDPNETYSWTPVAGGKGWGNPSGKASGTSSSGQGSSQGSGTTLVQPNSPAVSGQSGSGGGQGSGTTLVKPDSAVVPGQSGNSSQGGGGVTLMKPSTADVSGKLGINTEIQGEEYCED